MKTALAAAVTGIVVLFGTMFYYENADLTCIAGEMVIAGGTMAVETGRDIVGGSGLLDTGRELIEGWRD